MKKIILVLISLFVLTNMSGANADYCDSKLSPLTCVDYIFNTWHSERLVSIYVPENIEYIEYLVMTGELTKWYYFKLVYLNTLLIKRGYDPIY